ncbi:hypothetical protein NCCP2145_00850 [Pseudarthrobacter sp. NCCP-2145]|nr:hypothetical protein GCM10017547_39770 [Pseudarthrobacter oxydans]GKV70704.1 hypothetical protein NCCP2145_00850 [Pseudarthrobacter sp. NCCP-2145]
MAAGGVLTGPLKCGAKGRAENHGREAEKGVETASYDEGKKAVRAGLDTVHGWSINTHAGCFKHGDGDGR